MPGESSRPGILAACFADVIDLFGGTSVLSAILEETSFIKVQAGQKGAFAAKLYPAAARWLRSLVSTVHGALVGAGHAPFIYLFKKTVC